MSPKSTENIGWKSGRCKKCGIGFITEYRIGRSVKISLEPFDEARHKRKCPNCKITNYFV